MGERIPPIDKPLRATEREGLDEIDRHKQEIHVLHANSAKVGWETNLRATLHKLAFGLNISYST